MGGRVRGRPAHRCSPRSCASRSKDGIVHREVHEEVPARVEYSLTPLGQGLNDAPESLGERGAKHLLPDSA
ncbi:winged helix-turn-helix transcriptional regulator [Streptomyces sp. NRRL F-2580]|uniref:winged helix-turn-helix transcriptional regulator n=1 Tax=Streptomyces sp. NRRL F-2580 TaxID=1463841 RepID=UPI00099C88E0